MAAMAAGQRVLRFERLVVYAPPGKLGVIFSGDRQRIKTVRENSPLFGLVGEGDALLTVNGESVFGLSPDKVVEVVQRHNTEA